MPKPYPRHHDAASLPRDDLFAAYLHSLTLTNPNVTLDAGNNTLSIRPPPTQPQTVCVISGSARRFDPQIASFVGPGLLAACLAGGSDTSYPVSALPAIPALPALAPNAAERVRIALQDRALTMQKVLFIVTWGHDSEDPTIVYDAGLRARGRDPSMQFEQLNAPVTLHLLPTILPKPGAGLPLLLKICSATAARGYSLQEVLRVGKLVVKNLLSVSADLDCEVPDRNGSSGGPDYDRVAMEGEQGLSARIHYMLVWMLSRELRHPDFVEVNSNEVVLLVSGYNGLTMPEMEAVTSEVVKQLHESWNIHPVRIYTEAASVLSTLGRREIGKRDFAITILNVCNTDIGGPSMIELLDAPTEAVGWAALVQGPSWEAKYTHPGEHNVQSVKPSGLKCYGGNIWLGTIHGASAVIAFAKNNRLAGDDPHESWYGDPAAPAYENTHAQDMWNCARGATQALSSAPRVSEDVVILISDMLSCTRVALDSPFGALCKIFLSALMQSFQTQSDTATEVNVGVWIYALEQAWFILLEYARNRTAMAGTLDALDRFVATLHSTGDMLKAAKAAQPGEGMVNDLGAQLMCAFFAGLVGHLDRRFEEESVASVLKAGVPDKSLQKDTPADPTSETMEPAPTSAEEEHSRASDAAAVPAGLPESSTKEDRYGPEVDASLGTEATPTNNEAVPEGKVEQPAPTSSAEEEPSGTSDAAAVPAGSPESSTKDDRYHPEVVGSPDTEPTPTNKDPAPESEVEQPALTDEGDVTEASRDAIVDALQIKPSEFDAAMESIRSRTPVPLPTRQIEETTLLDMVRQQIASLGVSSDKGEAAAAGKDPDEEEYELV